ncbi:MAG: RIP metalloprotease RseP [Bacilli bacterium]|nr:RIP metalloprotease RseP [Bacilli bacterium]
MIVLQTLGNILLFLLVLSLVICIHELGHFIFAKRAGILCHEFSFGMGPKLWSRKIGETTFMIKLIPFGGYVAMAGEEIEAELVKLGQKVRLGIDQDGEVNRIVLNSNNPDYHDFIEVTVEDFDLQGIDGGKLYINEYTVKRDAYYVTDKKTMQIAPADRVFNSKTKWQRFLVAVAGPMMNFVLAFFVFLFMFLVGGVADPGSTVVAEVGEDMPAYDVLEVGDRIISINGVEIDSWSLDNGLPSVSSELSKYMESDTFTLVVERDGEIVTLEPIAPLYSFVTLNFSAIPGSDELTVFIAEEDERFTELRTGDIIKAIDNTTFTSWQEVIQFQKNYVDGSSEEDPTVILYERDGVEYTYEFVAYSEEVVSSQGYSLFMSKIGIAGSSKFSLAGSIQGAASSFVIASLMIYRTLGLLFTSDEVGVSDLSGFVGIFSMTANAAEEGFMTLLNWIGFLSVNLGIINLLPIPALDGGRIAFIGYEAITKKKPNQKVENFLHTIVFFLLIALLIFITYNDILRLFGSN